MVVFTTVWFWALLVGLPLCALAVLYNRLITYRNLVREAWSGVDVQLKLRHDLVPQLAAAVKAYADFESDLQEQVTRLRGMSMGLDRMAEVEEGEEALTGKLRPLLAVAEDYPDLKAGSNFLDLQARLVEVENHIQMARRYFNGTVRDYNTLAESFPALLVARAFGFRLRPFFEIDLATEREVPVLEFGNE